MELKLTVARALAYEEKTGKDVLEVVQRIADAAQTGKLPKLKDVIDLYSTMGDGYTAETFDEWGIPFPNKIKEIGEAASEFLQGKRKLPNAKAASVK